MMSSKCTSLHQLVTNVIIVLKSILIFLNNHPVYFFILIMKCFWYLLVFKHSTLFFCFFFVFWQVSLSMAGIMAADSVSHTLQVQQWDGEVRQESRHAAELKQLDNGLKIPPRWRRSHTTIWCLRSPSTVINVVSSSLVTERSLTFTVLRYSGWRCDVCDLQENLWMNLTDGKVLCGRRYFDGTGGNNHALLHFQETGYPLAVKLGTITPDGAGKHARRSRL